MKYLLKYVGIGLGIACFFHLLILCIFNLPSTRAGIIGTFILGIVIGAASCVYTIKRLPWLAKVAIQLIVGMIAFTIISLYNDWYSVSNLWIGIILFIVIFAIIWCIFYFNTRAKIEKMNKKIEGKKTK